MPAKFTTKTYEEKYKRAGSEKKKPASFFMFLAITNPIYMMDCVIIEFRSLDGSTLRKNEAKMPDLTLIFLPSCHTLASFFKPAQKASRPTKT